MEVLDPEFEIMFIKYYRKIVGDSIDFEKNKIFNNIEDYSRALLNILEVGSVHIHI